MRFPTLFFALVATSACSPALSDVRCDRLLKPDPMARETRGVQTRVVEHTAWKLSPGHDADELIAEVSDLWEEQFGIRFEVVAREAVTAMPMLDSLSEWHEEAKTRKFQDDEELILIFSRSAGLFPETAGILAGLVIVAPGPLDSSYHLLNHALGHVFGLGHDLSFGSFMDVNPLAVAPGVSMIVPNGSTDTSKSVIRTNKWCTFRPERPFYLRAAAPTEPEVQVATRPPPVRAPRLEAQNHLQTAAAQ